MAKKYSASYETRMEIERLETILDELLKEWVKMSSTERFSYIGKHIFTNIKDVQKELMELEGWNN